ncbi:MAG TPA: TolC family protein [Gemmataceae bacterium]|nr:TolC family protein [Gemmataceae bacterium]
MRPGVHCCLTSVRWVAGWVCLLCATGQNGRAQPLHPPAGPLEPLPSVLRREDAVWWALQYNPELAALRQQRGIAAAAVVIAETYPFNPIWEARVQGNSGPASAAITNSVQQEHRVALELEVRGQGQYRRQSAYAGLARTDWEIVFQEQTLAVRVIRAFNAVVYRRKKLQLLEQTVTLLETTLDQANRSFQIQRIPRGDVIVAEADLYDARSLLGFGRTALASAEYDLRRALGIVNQPLNIQGELDVPPPPWPVEALLQGALEQRADLRARQAGVSEAQARLDLEIANRYGNPTLGPIWSYDPTRVSSQGVSLTVPLPVLNSHRGEIQQRDAERLRSGLDLRQVEVLVQQDVAAALRHLREARAWQQRYEKEILPDLQNRVKEMQTLLEKGLTDPLRMSAFQRSLLRTRDSYLDALLEVAQAEAELAAAVGDPGLALNPGQVHK